MSVLVKIDLPPLFISLQTWKKLAVFISYDEEEKIRCIQKLIID